MSHEAHAGCLSLELSWQHHRIVVNCGLPATNRESWRQLARATAAHSTVTFNDTSSCRFLASGSLQQLVGVRRWSAGPSEVPVTREDRGDAMLLRASHDGYAQRYGVVHQRTIRLARNGSRLDGEDVFLPARGESLPSNKPDEYAIRFHLHPTVKASRLTDGHSVMLMLPNRQVWSFTAYEDRVDVEESVYLAATDGAAPRRADRDLRPCAHDRGRALDLRPARAHRDELAAAMPRWSRSCRYERAPASASPARCCRSPTRAASSISPVRSPGTASSSSPPAAPPRRLRTQG